jgi:V/A-type H+-transporting ATPase subunit I
MMILVLSIFGYTKLGKSSRTLKNFSYVGLWVGTVTTVMGILMGSFFGDLIPRFLYNDPDALLYSVQVAGISLPYDSFRNPMLLFQISLIIGLIIINLGIILGAVQSIRRKGYKDLVSKQLSWFVIQPPAIMLIGHLLLKLWELSGGMMIISAVALLVGLFMLSIQYAVSYKALTLFDITGFLGDWLSFVRLLALALATIGMALTFNIMGELILNIGSTPVTFTIALIIASVFMVIAHVINLGLQTLGASIHSLRLQYIELFNRCYEGGGSPFSPFNAGRVHTKIKKSNK